MVSEARAGSETMSWSQVRLASTVGVFVALIGFQLTLFADSPTGSADTMIFAADQAVTARDGTRLSLRIWRPAGEGRYPVVMQHTPYLSDESHARARRFVAAGFAYASLDRRGRGMSEGQYRPLEGSGPDGADAVAWLADQPWSDGRVMTRGGSYRGMTQWQLLAEHPEHLVASVPTASVYPGWDFPNPRGMFLAYAARWLAFVEGRSSNPGIFSDTSFWHARYLDVWRGDYPFSELAERAGVPGDTFQRWLSHPGYGDFWRGLNPTPEQYSGMTQPVLSITGYFDGDQEGTLRYYREHQQHAAPAAAERHWLLIGPWDHAGTRSPRNSVSGLQFDEAAVIDLDQLHIDWYRHVLDEAPRPDLLTDRVVFYVMGLEAWRSALSLEDVSDGEWVLYLDPADQPADHLYASGRLAESAPSPSSTTQYRYAPADGELHDDWSSDWEDDQLYVKHEQVFKPGQLFYHSTPIKAPKTVCGVPGFEAYLSVNVADTDIQVQIFEITSDNQVRWLASDMLRGRYRHGLDRAAPIEPGTIERWHFDRFWWTCRTLATGSHLRLSIRPVDTPDFDRNDHNGGGVPTNNPETWPAAEVTVHHGTDHPTRLVLPLRTLEG